MLLQKPSIIQKWQKLLLFTRVEYIFSSDGSNTKFYDVEKCDCVNYSIGKYEKCQKKVPWDDGWYSEIKI